MKEEKRGIKKGVADEIRINTNEIHMTAIRSTALKTIGNLSIK